MATQENATQNQYKRLYRLVREWAYYFNKPDSRERTSVLLNLAMAELHCPTVLAAAKLSYVERTS